MFCDRQSELVRMMGKMTLVRAAVLLICSMLLTFSEAQAPDCSTEISLLGPCLKFVSSLEPSPPPSCCAALNSVVAAKPVCLCDLLGYGGSLSLPPTYNLTRLNDLPGLCNIAADPAMCAALMNGGAPSQSPVASGPSVEGSGGVKGGGPTSHGVSRKIPGTVLTIVQFAAAPALASLLIRVYCY
ncbi:unnamed protein product [Calypogeia fissa]